MSAMQQALLMGGGAFRTIVIASEVGEWTKYTADGVNWFTNQPPTATDAGVMLDNGSLFMQRPRRSANGLLWTTNGANSNAAINVNAVAYSPSLGRWVFSVTQQAYSSLDGVTWTAAAAFPGIGATGLVWDAVNSCFICCFSQVLRPVQRSTDGLTWSAGGIPPGLNAAHGMFPFDGKIYLIGAQDPSPVQPTVWESSDGGVTWSTLRTIVDTFITYILCAGSADIFIAATTTFGLLQFSTFTRGVGWVDYTPPTPTWGGIPASLLYKNGAFWLNWTFGSVMRSSDGINWVEVDTTRHPIFPGTSKWKSIA